MPEFSFGYMIFVSVHVLLTFSLHKCLIKKAVVLVVVYVVYGSAEYRGHCYRLQIGHFRDAESLCFKTRPSAKPFL